MNKMGFEAAEEFWSFRRLAWAFVLGVVFRAMGFGILEGATIVMLIFLVMRVLYETTHP